MNLNPMESPASQDSFLGSRGLGAEEPAEDDNAEEAAPPFEGPLSALFALYHTPHLFTPGVLALCDACGLEAPLPVLPVDLLADLLARLPVSHLRCLAAMLDLTVPVTRWSVQTRNNRVLRPLAEKLHATLIAYSAFMEHGSRDEEGGGGGGGFGGLGGERKTKPSPRTPTPSMLLLNPRKVRPYESLRDYTAKQGMARQLSRVVEQFHSMYSDSLAFLAASGRFPRVHANVASMPVDIMCATLNAMTTEVYAASLMKKSATLSSKRRRP